MGVKAMSKKFQKDVKRSVSRHCASKISDLSKVDENSALEAVIGAGNVKRWNLLKASFFCETNESFTTKLLNLAEDFLNKDSCKEKDVDESPKKDYQENGKPKRSKKAEKKEAACEETSVKNVEDTEQDDKSKKKKSVVKKEKVVETKKKIEHDIRKAPDLGVQTESKSPLNQEEDIDRVAIKIKLCQNCSTRHIQDQCPLNYPNFMISDSLTMTEWQEKYKNLKEISEDNDQFIFAKISIPSFLELNDTNTPHGLGVWAKVDVQEFTQFGPLIGAIVKEVDIPEDSTMRDLWEIFGENSNIYFNTENYEDSNWMRFVRPAPNRDDKNIAAINKDGQVFFISTKLIKNGEELLYWQDSSLATNKKKMEKTSCGGCNMTFAHPIYYRIHCSVFHDVRYSLTIRKYHCKVCGAAVLGKENIMKHAAELHNGQGAYQCQFCKKFFLRLNYLEMHRTYGCSSNPHRSRPLCDFCGRKFCQPQKLKVHIKRMHSDFAEVLKEFQCKSCMKILGSRAALQRHAKEVHQKQLDGACSCSRCGKHFQNKSNLKIHMLTHSGIKPFKCAVKSCNAAFTTKQCLQFHYKKVHNLAEGSMPKIERSIDYTFEAYSGVEDQIDGNKENSSGGAKHYCSDGQEDSDMDDASMDSKTLDDPPIPDSPLQVSEEHSPEPPRSPPQIETYHINPVKILSKGSKKWIGDQPLQPFKPDLYQKDDLALQPESQSSFDRSKLNSITDFTRHEASNASLLVEAALDSVCSEPNIDIDVTTPNCTDALVNNLYTLAPPDTLPDVSYGDAVCMNDQQLMSPNDHISVTDELSEELHRGQNMGLDYSGFHQDFSPTNSPENQHRSNFVRNYINQLSPQNYGQPKTISPVPSPPRYDFGHAVVNSDEDSNGMGAQNLSLHSKQDIQLDLSIYKSSYKISEPRNKDFRIKFDDKEDENNIEEHVDVLTQNDLSNDIQEKDDRNKFDIDLDLRIKNYEDENGLRRSLYEGDLDFRKSYDEIERNKAYDLERNFEPLVLNSSELQGLDMSARSFHNYSNINRYHHLYPDVDRVDLRLSYSPPAPSYTHSDILRVVSLDLTPPGRHSVDLSLRSHPFNSRLLSEHGIQATPHRILEPGRLLSSDLSGRILSDHTTNRILSNSDQLLNDDQPRLLEQSRLIGDGRLLSTTPSGAVSPVPFGGYSVPQSPYHPTPLAPRPHVSSPTPTPYHHYSTYY